MLRKHWKLGLGLALVMVLTASCGQVAEQTVGPAVQVEADSGLDQLPDGPVARPGPTPARLHHLPRTAIVLELYYALNQGIGGRSTKMINGCNVSDWGYLSDYWGQEAYNYLKGKYAENSTEWEVFWSNPVYYSYMRNKWGGGYWSTQYGRGGQCRFFANLILFRSATYMDNYRVLPMYKQVIDDYVSNQRRISKPIGQVEPGDVIQTRWVGGHTAIVVQIMARDSQGRVTSVDVIDSNFVGSADNEIIGRHVISSIPSGVGGNGGTGDLDSYIALKLNYI